jgi:hypothetical protein
VNLQVTSDRCFLAAAHVADPIYPAWKAFFNCAVRMHATNYGNLFLTIRRAGDA